MRISRILARLIEVGFCTDWLGRLATQASALHVICREASAIAPHAPARTRRGTDGLLLRPDSAAFSPTHTRERGRLYPCYVSQTVKHGAGACRVGRVLADEVEPPSATRFGRCSGSPRSLTATFKAARAC